MILIILALAASQVAGDVLHLSCADNATCIDSMAKEFVQGIRQNRAVKLFDVLTVEPLQRTEGRSQKGLARFFDTHAFTFDWADYAFRFSKPQERSDAVELEVFQGREAPEKTIRKNKTSKDDGADDDEKTTKRLRRRQKRKVLQALLPMMFGMKSAGTVIFSLAVVTALTIKAFLASKLALAVTVGMAVKKLYESYSNGVGLQNHPYLYSQYPVDFPSASSHAYSVSGMAPHFPSSEVYSPTALASHSHAHEILQQQDATAQQSQASPTLHLVNATRATERWDGKSKLLKFLEPAIEGFKSMLDPIAKLFTIPATFRDMKSNVPATPAKEVFIEPVTEGTKIQKAKEMLIAQPRYIAQRKSIDFKREQRNKPKKYTELNISLDRLKQNKDYIDYVKTKKYKFNYPYTHYYPRVRHYVNPNIFFQEHNNFQIAPRHTRHFLRTYHNTNTLRYNEVVKNNLTLNENNNIANNNDWKPMVISPISNKPSRVKRDLKANTNSKQLVTNKYGKANNDVRGRGFLDFFFGEDPLETLIKQANEYTKNMLKHNKKTQYNGPPKYYLITYDMVIFSLQVIDDFVNMKSAIYEHLFKGGSKEKYGDHKGPKKDKKKTKKGTLHRS